MTPFDFAVRHAHRAEMRRYQPVEGMDRPSGWAVTLNRAANGAACLAFILLAISIYAYATRPLPPVAHSPGAAASAIHQPADTTAEGRRQPTGDAM